MGFFFEPSWNGGKGFLVILCYFFLSTLVNPCFGAETISLKWEVEYMHWSPDCIDSVVMGINDTFPGPEIRARVGDTLNITVVNKLATEGVVIHWHGIEQKGTPWFDGTASISQCPINPGESFVYKFKVDKPGTYFYHGHYGMQRAAGLYGSLIVELRKGEKEPFPIPYDKEFNLLLSDWWHQSVHKQEVDLSSKPFRFIGEPQTLLINGRGQYNCSLAAGSRSPSPSPSPSPYPSPSPSPFPSPSTQSSEKHCDFDVTTEENVLRKHQCGPVILKVEKGKTYRLRVVSTTSLSSLNLQIANHKMKVVEADGNYVKPFDVDDFDIYSGESYSVLVTADQDESKNYWISVGVRGRKPGTEQALAILRYTNDDTYPTSSPPVTPDWDDYTHSIEFVKKVVSNTLDDPKLLANEIRTIKLLNQQAEIDGYLKWVINGISLTLPPTPYLGSVKYGIEKAFDKSFPPDSDKPRHSSAVFKLGRNEMVDVVLQNAKMLNGHSEIHPWHLHGHDFWVLGYGDGTFDENNDNKLNTNNPPLKNTVSVFPDGWTVLRFRADNPGVWAFHCHIEPHLHMGMGIIFVEDAERIKEMRVPNEAISCGRTAEHLMNPINHTPPSHLSPQPSPQ